MDLSRLEFPDLAAEQDTRDRFLARCRVAPFSEFLELERNRHRILPILSGRALAPLRTGRHRARLLLATVHWSGFVRERALKTICRELQIDDLPFLLIRTCDWVPKISRLAQDSVQNMLREHSASILLPYIDFLPWLARQSRTNRSPFISEIERKCIADCGPHTVWEAAHPDDLRYFAELLAEHGDIDEEFARELLLSPQPQVSSVGARYLSANPELISLGLQSGFAGTRLFAVSALGESRIAGDDPRLIGMISDPSSTVRAAARFYLEKAGYNDFVASYREQIAHGIQKDGRGAILGLAEVGSAEDVDVIRPYLAHTNRQVRDAAFKAIRKLRPESLVSDLPNLLGRISPNLIVSFASEYPGSIPDVEDLLNSPEPTKRRFGFRLMFQRRSWVALVWIWRALADEDPKLRTLAAQQSARWIAQRSRTVILPSDDEWREFLRVYQAHPNLEFPIHLAEEMNGILAWVGDRMAERQPKPAWDF